MKTGTHVASGDAQGREVVIPKKQATREVLAPKFRGYGFAGLGILILAEVLMFMKVEPVASFFTPIAWTGYILVLDAVLFRLRGESWIVHRPGQFIFMAVFSIVAWVWFELYNLHLQNWRYIGLPQNLAVRVAGYAWAFATIFPGILLTSQVIDSLGVFQGAMVETRVLRWRTLYVWMVVGALCVTVPLFVPSSVAKYLFGLVWVGYVFLLDPINYFLGTPSLFRDLERGKLDKLLSLFLAGALCGFLWEFWNYWATAKWEYTVPFLQEPKIFEMPLFGFLGFLPFAVECYVMYHLAWWLWRRTLEWWSP